MLFSLCYFSAEPSAVEEGFGEGVWHGRDSSLPPVRVNPLPVSQTSSRTGCVRQSCLCAVSSYITTCHGLGNKPLPSDEWAGFRFAGALHLCELMSLSSHCKSSDLSLDALLECSFRSPGKLVCNAEFLLVSTKIAFFFLLR